MSKWISKLLRIFEILLIVIILITIFVVAYNFIELKILKRDHVNVFGFSVFEVISDSMAPTIGKKDIIVVKLNDNIEKNDIVTYKKDGAFITHRVVDIKDEYLITRGDANNSKDVPISKDITIGKVKLIIPNLGIWRDILVSPKVLILIIITLILFNIALSGNSKQSRKKGKNCDFKLTSEGIIEEILGEIND